MTFHVHVRILMHSHERLNTLLLHCFNLGCNSVAKVKLKWLTHLVFAGNFMGKKKKKNHSAVIKHQFEINSIYLYSLWCSFPIKYILESNNINNKHLEVSKN